jgi:hypothetical protein
MDQKAIILYLHRNWMALDAMHDDPGCTLERQAVSHSPVRTYVQNARFTPRTEAIVPEPAEGRHGPVDEAISATVEKKPFSSVQELSRLTCLPCFTVHRHLTQSLGLLFHHFRRIPHLLTPQQKRFRVDRPLELLRVSSVQMTRQWHDIVILDESWIYVHRELS